jgi:uncharacterized protein YecA (UPF0149 family)
MASTAQMTANQLNAQHSTGPQTAAGKARVSCNALKLGLFSLRDFVRPEETDDYQLLTTSLWNELAPATILEQALTTEIIRATWRLHRCSAAEADNAADIATDLDPIADQSLAPTQKSIDRARSQATHALHKAIAELRRLKAERPAPASAPNSNEPKTPEPKQTHSHPPTITSAGEPIPRNCPCPCKSGLKYKRCCGPAAPAVLNINGHPEICTCPK